MKVRQLLSGMRHRRNYQTWTKKVPFFLFPKGSIGVVKGRRQVLGKRQNTMSLCQKSPVRQSLLF